MAIQESDDTMPLMRMGQAFDKNGIYYLYDVDTRRRLDCYKLTLTNKDDDVQVAIAEIMRFHGTVHDRRIDTYNGND